MRRSILSILPVILATGACFSLGRDTPPLQQYVLGGTPAAAAGAMSSNPAGVTIGLRRLDLTPYLASSSIVVRRGANQVIVSQYHRWGEDPVAGINRAFAGYLAAAQPVTAVDVAPWPARSQHDFVVQLHVLRFEGVTLDDAAATHGGAHLLASWEVHRPQDGAVLARGGTDYREDGWLVGDYAALVTLLNHGLDRMASEVVACLNRVGTPSAAQSTVSTQPLACAGSAEPAVSGTAVRQ
ncbi:MAG TPA: PqiC family protein [Longimicrobiales bacterium]|nr:PqiC family protein [Longimicrobiales bacterium]